MKRWDLSNYKYPLAPYRKFCPGLPPRSPQTDLMISFLVKKVQSCRERCRLNADPAQGPPSSPLHPTLISASAAHRAAPGTLADSTPRTKGSCPQSSYQKNKAARPTEGSTHHSYLICFQLLMSEDCLLVAHGKGHCQEQVPEAPKSPQGHAVARLPCTSVWANLPALAVTRPPALSPPSWVRLKLQPSSLANSLSMSMATRARRRAVGGQRASDNICHH